MTRPVVPTGSAPPRRGFSLPGDGLDLWLLFTGNDNGTDALPGDATLLDPTERHRYQRLGARPVGQRYLRTRWLVRTTLSRYQAVAPGRWQFVTGAHGRPEIASPESRLRFNLAHTDSLIVCAVTVDAAVGVDVECTQRSNRLAAIAERFFAGPELRQLRARPPAQRIDGFFDIWTLKEAYLKARGLGVAGMLRRFAFDLPAGGPIRLTPDPTLADPLHAYWRFRLASPGPRHRLALCTTAPGPIRVWQIEAHKQFSAFPLKLTNGPTNVGSEPLDRDRRH